MPRLGSLPSGSRWNPRLGADCQRLYRHQGHVFCLIAEIDLDREDLKKDFPYMSLEFVKAGSLSQPHLREIETFLDSQDTAHVFQFPQWTYPNSMCALLRQGGEVKWVGIFGMQSPMGSNFPLVRAWIANRGPVCDDGELWRIGAEELAQHLQRERIAHFDVTPDWIQSPDTPGNRKLDGSSWQQIGPGRCSLRLDLTKNEDEIFANFRKNTRYEIRRAERAGVSVESASSDSEIDEFLALYLRMAELKRFHPPLTERMRRQIRWIIGSKSRGALLLARLDNCALGGVVLGRCGRRCWYVWGANDRHKHLSVGQILQSRALLWATAHGCSEYDFGGYTPGATSGTAWFKAGFGGTVVQFVPPHRRSTHAGRHRWFTFLSRIRTGRFRS